MSSAGPSEPILLGRGIRKLFRRETGEVGPRPGQGDGIERIAAGCEPDILARERPPGRVLERSPHHLNIESELP